MDTPFRNTAGLHPASSEETHSEREGSEDYRVEDLEGQPSDLEGPAVVEEHHVEGEAPAARTASVVEAGNVSWPLQVRVRCICDAQLPGNSRATHKRCGGREKTLYLKLSD